MRQIDHTPQIAFVQTIDVYLLVGSKARHTRTYVKDGDLIMKTF